MKINHIFMSINAEDFDGQSNWWVRLIGRRWDREPMPSCREWSLSDDMLLQVLDSADGYGGATITLHVPELAAEIDRLKSEGIHVSQPVKIEGFETLRFAQFADPEGNTVGLLDGH